MAASSTLETFLQNDLDRCAFISAWLHAREVPHTIVELAGKKHIVVRFANEAYDPRFRMKTLIAHYDRTPGTPGANDNSAACFQLMLFAERLAGWESLRPAGSMTAHNIRIIFTDGEEAAGTKGITGQGAFALGSGFRKLKMTNDDVYVFDACGRGDTLILSTAGLDNPARNRVTGSGGKPGLPHAFLERLERLHDRAAALARTISPENHLQIYTPYSDNAGFLAAGIPAQVITVLPHEEASILVQALMETDPEKTAPDAIRKIITENRYHDTEPALASLIPETWKLMHTPEDTAPTLTAEAFSLVGRFLEALAARMELAF